MPRDPRAFLWDVRQAADNIATFIRDKTAANYAAEQLEIIGEALNQLDKVAPEIGARIPHLRQIVGLRNILIHGYAVVKHDLIWRSVREDLPELRATVDALLAKRSEP